MTEHASTSAAGKGPLEAAQKIVAELQGMDKVQQGLAVKFAMETLGLLDPIAHSETAQPPPYSAPPRPHTAVKPPVPPTDIKTFTTAKAPKSDQQFAAVVAYYYRFEVPADQQRHSIDAPAMRDAARLAGRKQVTDWRMTLDNARRSGFLDKAERGAFKLNAVGENLVAITLPDIRVEGKPKSRLGRKKVKKKRSTKKLGKNG